MKRTPSLCWHVSGAGPGAGGIRTDQTLISNLSSLKLHQLELGGHFAHHLIKQRLEHKISEPRPIPKEIRWSHMSKEWTRLMWWPEGLNGTGIVWQRPAYCPVVLR